MEAAIVLGVPKKISSWKEMRKGERRQEKKNKRVKNEDGKVKWEESVKCEGMEGKYEERGDHPDKNTENCPWEPQFTSGHTVSVSLLALPPGFILVVS